MNWVFLIVLCALLVELVLRLPFVSALQALQRTSRRAMAVVTAKRISDHWKEKAMGAYASRTFIASAQIAGLLAIVLGVATLLVLAFDWFWAGFQTFILGWVGLVSSVVAASLYIIIRKKLSHG